MTWQLHCSDVMQAVLFMSDACRLFCCYMCVCGVDPMCVCGVFSHASDNLLMKEREVKSLRRQVESGVEDLQESNRGRDIAVQENRRLQDDLAVMTRENQVSDGWLDVVMWYPSLGKSFMHGHCCFLLTED